MHVSGKWIMDLDGGHEPWVMSFVKYILGLSEAATNLRGSSS